MLELPEDRGKNHSRSRLATSENFLGFVFLLWCFIKCKVGENSLCDYRNILEWVRETATIHFIRWRRWRRKTSFKFILKAINFNWIYEEWYFLQELFSSVAFLRRFFSLSPQLFNLPLLKSTNIKIQIESEEKNVALWKIVNYSRGLCRVCVDEELTIFIYFLLFLSS